MSHGMMNEIYSAPNIGTSYIVGGLVPLALYMLLHDSGHALGKSAANSWSI